MKTVINLVALTLYTLEQVDSLYNWAMKVFQFISAFFDNWFYLGRIGTYKWSSDFESTWVSRCGTGATIICYTMELCKEYEDAKLKAGGDRAKMLDILHNRRWFILMKLLEYPVRN